MMRILLFALAMCTVGVSAPLAQEQKANTIQLPDLSPDLSGSNRVFGKVSNGVAVMTYSVPMLRREVEHNLNDLRLNEAIHIQSVSLQHYGGPYYLVATGNVANRPIIVAYDLLLDSVGNLGRPYGGIHADMLRSMEGGLRNVCLGENCVSCAFTKNAAGIITGCSGKSLPSAKPKGYCNHTISTQVESIDSLFRPQHN